MLAAYDEMLARVFDPLFVTPFVTGLAYSVLLPIFGAYLRLRDEWLAALAFAQTAAAGNTRPPTGSARPSLRRSRLFIA